MLTDFMNDANIVIWIFIGWLSAWGGVVKYIIEHPNSRQKIHLNELMKSMVISSFAGMMGGLLSFEMGMTHYMILLMSGLCGTMGSSAIHYLQEITFRRKRKDDEKL